MRLILAAIIVCAFATGSYSQDSSESERRIQQLVKMYVPVTLKTDLSVLSDNQKQIVTLLIKAGKEMDRCFWYEAFGDPSVLLNDASPAERAFINLNYGPWDRLNDNVPFLNAYRSKPLGANFYPSDMTADEFQAADLPGKDGLYTFLRRDQSGNLITIPYHQQFNEQVTAAAEYLRAAAELAESASFRRYLLLRADALLNDDYQPSDFAWLDMKDNLIDVVIGPIETYEDQLFGYKAAHECYVLIKDMEWSERLAKYSAFLPELQRTLPVPEEYKREKPGTDTELNAYDVIYYAGDCNAGSKTIAINLPNDEEVQLKRGTRRLQLKNAMQAKYEKILVPIAEELIHPSQRDLISFDAFFANTMFHEVAHGLGIKNTLDGQSTVREALQAHSSTIEEGKADILGLHMIQQLHAKGEIDGDLDGYYTTFMAGIFRSVRFGAASAHGRANMIRFNFFLEQGAFERTDEGYYRVKPSEFSKATEALARKLLMIQGDGSLENARQLSEQLGRIRPQLQSDLDRLSKKGIPVDVVFEQGLDVLGL